MHRRTTSSTSVGFDHVCFDDSQPEADTTPGARTQPHRTMKPYRSFNVFKDLRTQLKDPTKGAHLRPGGLRYKCLQLLPTGPSIWWTCSISKSSIPHTTHPLVPPRVLSPRIIRSLCRLQCRAQSERSIPQA